MYITLRYDAITHVMGYSLVYTNISMHWETKNIL